MKKTILLLLFVIISSCTSKAQDEKWINANKLCDSIKIENIKDNDYIFHFSKINLPAKKENSLFKIFRNGTEIVGVISKDTILNINGTEYKKEGIDKIGDLNKIYVFQDCEDENSMINFSYDKEENSFSLGLISMQSSLKSKKISETEYELYFDNIEGSNGSNSFCEYARKYYSKNKKVGTVKFLSNNVLKIYWIGFYDNKTKKKEILIPYFKNSTELYFKS